MRQETQLVRAVSVLMVALLGVTVTGCSGPKPIVYPNAHAQAAGERGLEQDIAQCREVAEQAGAEESTGQAGRAVGNTAMGAGVGAAGGAIGGAISGGDVGLGALIGAATGAVWGLFSWMFGWMFSSSQPSPTYVNMVNRCLAEKGYEVGGWQ